MREGGVPKHLLQMVPPRIRDTRDKILGEEVATFTGLDEVGAVETGTLLFRVGSWGLMYSMKPPLRPPKFYDRLIQDVNG